MRFVDVSDRAYNICSCFLCSVIAPIDLRVIRRERKQFDESVAVIRYHRMLVLENLGRSDDAERDRQRVIELGFEPNDELF